MENPWCRARASASETMATATSDPTKLAPVMAETPQSDRCRRREMASMAPSAAPAETPCERRGQGISEQGL